MLAAGIKTPVPLDELEIHLREGLEDQMKSGLNPQQGFEITVQQIGQSNILKNEFAKVGGTKTAQVKHLVLTLAGIPNQHLDTNMNTPSANIEPRWATYLKAAAFLLPAASLWLLIIVFVFPKFHEDYKATNIPIPDVFVMAVNFIIFLQNHFLWVFTSLMLVLALLEWRSSKWPRYRRAVAGVGVIFINSIILVLVTAMLITILIAIGNHGPVQYN